MLRLTVVLCGVMFAFMALVPEPEGRIFGNPLVFDSAEFTSAVVSAPLAVAPEPVAVAVSAPVAVAPESRSYVAPAVQADVLATADVPGDDRLTAIVLAAVIADSRPAPRPVQTTPEPVVVEPARIVWFVTGSRVNVRQGPSTEFGIMGQVVYGEAAEIVSDPNQEWVKIRIEGDGVEGYIAKRFMSETEPQG
jgi:hypothetical protein